VRGRNPLLIPPGPEEKKKVRELLSPLEKWCCLCEGGGKAGVRKSTTSPTLGKAPGPRKNRWKNLWSGCERANPLTKGIGASPLDPSATASD